MSARRWMLGVVTAGALVLMAWAPAWACVSGPAVHFSTTVAKPGDQISVTGSGFNTKGPVAVRWNSLTGPVLTTMHVPDDSGAMGAFTVPAGTQTGTYVVIFTQSSSDGQLRQAPIRGVVAVSGSGTAAPVPLPSSGAARVDSLVTDSGSVATGSLALIALGVAGGVILLAGLGVFLAGRRSSSPEAVKTSR
ncbi:MAG: hypothetical protein M3083_23835 [Actinomycetota bacterium]|nr:hypothetical protein [Actinomycetota bacterium]